MDYSILVDQPKTIDVAQCKEKKSLKVDLILDQLNRYIWTVAFN